MTRYIQHMESYECLPEISKELESQIFSDLLMTLAQIQSFIGNITFYLDRPVT